MKSFRKVEFVVSLAPGLGCGLKSGLSPLHFAPENKKRASITRREFVARASALADEMIFTSVALDPPEGDVWWEGETSTSPGKKPSHENESPTK